MLSRRRARLAMFLACVLVTSASWLGQAGTARASGGPTANFDYSMPDRFGLDGNADGLIDYDYSTAFIDPSSWAVNFDGCSSQAGSSPIVAYSWDLAGFATVSTAECVMPHPPSVFPSLGQYAVTLTVTSQDRQTDAITKTITVKDLLIVSVGDSNASGEGNPDKGQEFDFFGFPSKGPVWEDRKCHRSANAGTAKAALALERADPKSSVTFVHLACSGASIQGGLIGGYGGIEPDGIAIPPQVLQAARLVCPVPFDPATSAPCPVTPRTIDALFISIGVNDLGFGDIVVACIVIIGCDTDTTINNDLNIRLAATPGLYDQLADFISRKLHVTQTYITEYADPTTDEHGDFCANILGGISQTEVAWASQTFIGDLNSAVKNAAQAHGWDFVGGIASQFIGHGYCAGDQRWIVTEEDSRYIQGPFCCPADNKGTLHPNGLGHDVTAGRLVAHVTAPGPTYEAFNGLVPLVIVDTVGDGGWLIGSCGLFSGCVSDAVYASIFVKAPSGIRSTTISGCSAAAGISCTLTTSIDTHNGVDTEDGWFATFTQDGVYELQIDTTDRNGKSNRFRYDVKVDLHDPTASASIASGTLGNEGWYRSAVSVQFTGSDGGSGLARFESSLDGAPTVLTAIGDTLPIATDASHVLSYQAVDRAGRRSAPQTLAVKLDAAAPTIGGAPDRAPDVRGWYKHDVTVHFTASDATSGVSSLTSDAVLGEGAAQSVSGTAIDHAGNSSTATVGPLSIDETKPTLAITGGTDGIFSYSPTELANGVFTNAPSFTLSYSASDALSGLYQVRLDAAASSAASGSLTVPLAAGISTHTVTAEDIAGNVQSTAFSVVSAPAGTFSGGVAPQGGGFWKNAVKNGAYSSADMSALLREVDAASQAFGATQNRYADATLTNYLDDLNPAPRPTLDDKVRRELLTAWLDLVSGREPAGQAVDVSSVSGWPGIVTNTSGTGVTTALNVVLEVERRLATSPSDVQLSVIADLLGQLNSGTLNR